MNERWSAQDKALFKATVRMWPVLVVAPLLTLFSVKFMAYHDGGGYLNMAGILSSSLSSDFPDGWDFVREPGFPLLLRFTVLTPLGVPGYLVVSGFMAGAAVAAMGGTFYDLGRHWQRLVAGVIAVSASVYISYAGFVMQQIGLTLLLALVGLNIRSIQTADGIKPLRFLLLGLIGAVGILYSFVFFGTVLLSAVVVAIIVALRLRGTSWKQALVGFISVGFVVAVPAVAYTPWNILKQNETASVALTTSGTSLPGSFAQSTSATFFAEGPNTFIHKRYQTAKVLLQLPGPAPWLLAQPWPEIKSMSDSEDIFFATRGSDFENPQCGIFYMGPEKMSWAVGVLLKGRTFCQPVDGSGFWSALARPSYSLGGVASIVMAIGTVWAVFRRRQLLAVLVLPWGWVAMYSMGIAIDRYAIPTWPYKTVFSIILVLMSVVWIMERFLRNRSAEDSNLISSFEDEVSEPERVTRLG